MIVPGAERESAPSRVLTRSRSPIDSPYPMEVRLGDMRHRTYTILPMQDGVNVEAHREYRKEI